MPGNSRCKSSWWSFLSTTAETALKRIIVIDEQVYKIMRMKHFGSVTAVNRTLQPYPENWVIKSLDFKRWSKFKGRAITTASITQMNLYNPKPTIAFICSTITLHSAFLIIEPSSSNRIVFFKASLLAARLSLKWMCLKVWGLCSHLEQCYLQEQRQAVAGIR